MLALVLLPKQTTAPIHSLLAPALHCLTTSGPLCFKPSLPQRSAGGSTAVSTLTSSSQERSLAARSELHLRRLEAGA